MRIYEEKKAELSQLLSEMESFDGYGFYSEGFDEFYESGNRLRYENKYFEKRKCLTVRAVNAILNGEADRDLIEIINDVCAEPVWALPAHVDRDTKAPEKTIDLFSAETAQTLSEIACYVKLPTELGEKIRKLLYDRIIEPYESGSFFWETSEHNWAAVCAGCVGMVYMYAFPKRFPTVKDRILKTISCFLSGYGSDGACLEGLGYWGYGFGYFAYFSELLRRFDGTDLLSDEKVSSIAQFSQSMFLKNGVCVSFSDSRRVGGFNAGLACFLKKEFSAPFPDISCRADLDECSRFAPYLRSFMWLDENMIETSKTERGDKYFSDAQWYIARREKFAFAAKGGHNGEPHNHNDVGGFIITDGAEQLIADLGAGEYTRDYFNNDKRYDYFCASSLGHSVPIVEGECQRDGEEYRAEVLSAGDSKFKLDIGGAYGGVKLIREFKISDNKITLCDTLYNNAVERLVSLVKPKTNERDTKIKNMTIRANVRPEINAVTIKNHDGADETVYTIDYNVSAGKFKCEFIFG